MLTKEQGETVVISRAQVAYSLIKKAVPKNKPLTWQELTKRANDYWEKNANKIIAAEPFLQDYGTSFLDSKTWIRRHSAYIQVEAARDGYAIMTARKGGKFAGVMLTRNQRKIETAMDQRQKSVSSHIERHNELAETLNSNTRYQLQFPYFPDGLLLPSGKKD